MTTVFKKIQFGLIVHGTTGLLCIADPGQTFSSFLPPFEKNPEQREEISAQIQQQRYEEKTNAIAWAKTQGLPTREEKENRLREMMAVYDGTPIYYITANANAAISTAANLVRKTSPYNVAGSAIRVGIWDGGSVLSTHQEFDNRITIQDGSTNHYHATHVGGTIAAAGVKSAAKGMAPDVFVDSYDWDDDTAELTTAAASAPGQTNAVYLSNHSYSYDTSDSSSYYLFGCYTAWVRDMDIAIHGAQYCLSFAAAGNERNDAVANGYGEYDTISLFGIAKNTMTVGAVNDAVSGETRSLANATMTTFSSWGPADDGRIKPDIVANGYGLYSTYNSSDTSYATMSGTSMATPNACGSAALLVEYYKNQTSGGAMLASTLKGLIIQTADDLGNAGPDYSYGWGLMNTLEAAAVIRDYSNGNTNRIIEGELSSSGTMSHSYTISSSGKVPLRITLCWTDQPGLSDGYIDDDRNSDLVNDLDLTVIGPSGTNYPYKLDYTDPSALATADSKNSIDNVEQIYIESPAKGNYTIIVDCSALFTYALVPRGRNTSEELTSGGSQSYSLLITGLPSDTDGDSLPDEWEQFYFGDTTSAENSADADGDGTDNLTEYVAGTNPTNSDSAFKVTTFATPLTNDTGFVLTWDAMTGRVYNVDWNGNLSDGSFTNISGDLPYPANSYTDRVERTDEQIFYRIGVRLDQ